MRGKFVGEVYNFGKSSEVMRFYERPKWLYLISEILFYLYLGFPQTKKYIDYNVDINSIVTYELKRIDNDYFIEE